MSIVGSLVGMMGQSQREREEAEKQRQEMMMKMMMQGFVPREPEAPGPAPAPPGGMGAPPTEPSPIGPGGTIGNRQPQPPPPGMAGLTSQPPPPGMAGLTPPPSGPPPGALSKLMSGIGSGLSGAAGALFDMPEKMTPGDFELAEWHPMKEAEREREFKRQEAKVQRRYSDIEFVREASLKKQIHDENLAHKVDQLNLNQEIHTEKRNKNRDDERYRRDALKIQELFQRENLLVSKDRLKLDIRKQDWTEERGNIWVVNDEDLGIISLVDTWNGSITQMASPMTASYKAKDQFERIMASASIIATSEDGKRQWGTGTPKENKYDSIYNRVFNAWRTATGLPAAEFESVWKKAMKGDREDYEERDLMKAVREISGQSSYTGTSYSTDPTVGRTSPTSTGDEVDKDPWALYEVYGSFH